MRANCFVRATARAVTMFVWLFACLVIAEAQKAKDAGNLPPLTLPHSGVTLETLEIGAGRLIVKGATRVGRQTVTIDRSFHVVSGGSGAFSLALAYLPADCIIDIQTGFGTDRAIVGNCGPSGAVGPKGPIGPRGPAGPKGSSGFSNIETSSHSSFVTVSSANSDREVSASCLDSKKLIGGGYKFSGDTGGFTVLQSSPHDFMDTWIVRLLCVAGNCSAGIFVYTICVTPNQ
jgi:hypothetical protein